MPPRRLSSLLLPLALALALPAVGGCPRTGGTPRDRGGATVDVAAERRHLVLPPTADSAAALARLRKGAEAGDAQAAWAFLHYGLDLFDAARFGGDEAARKTLLGVLGLEDGRGPAVTDQALDLLLVAADRALAEDRLATDVLAARTLLAFDRAPPTARRDLFGRIGELKAVARGGGPLAPNATLRLATFCARAFRDATAAPAPYRPGILAFCLYPLHDSDPEPYFAEDPARRPPEPAWADLAAGTRALLADVGRSDSRLAPLGARLVNDLDGFLAEARPLLPTRRQPAEVGAPIVPAAVPYEWTPIVHLGDGSKPPAADLAKKLAPILSQDGRSRVAIGLATRAPAAALLRGADVAAETGAHTVELLVGYTQELKAPAGDYWHGKLKDGRVERLGVLPLALEPFVARATGGGARDVPRTARWDPARATLGLHLVVGRGGWQLVAPTGSFPAIPPGASAAATLREQLARVRAAFPDEEALVVVPEEGATIGDLAAALVAARTDATGAPLFATIGLGRKRPAVTKRDLADRVARRAGVKVTVVPDVLADRVPLVRRCYLDALDRSPKAGGTVTLALDADGRAQVSGPPLKDTVLQGCIVSRLAPAMAAGNVQSARVELAP